MVCIECKPVSYEKSKKQKENENIADLEGRLAEADIIVMNLPFSLFREFLAWIVDANKQFVIVGNQNAITYKEENKIRQKGIRVCKRYKV